MWEDGITVAAILPDMRLSVPFVPFISMHTTKVRLESCNLVAFAVYEGETHRRPTSEGNDWLGFEFPWAHNFKLLSDNMKC
jgi:hypothetical protein